MEGDTMSIATLEEEAFGKQLTVVERAMCGIVAAAGAVGHIILGTAAVVFLYLIVTGL